MLLAAPCWANTDDFIENEIDFIRYDNMSHETMLYLLDKRQRKISIATGSQQPLYQAPAVASVITAQEIQQMGAIDIDDALTQSPGLHVMRNGNTNVPNYIIRGIYSNYNPQVLVLLNGVPLTNSFTGNRSQIWGVCLLLV